MSWNYRILQETNTTFTLVEAHYNDYSALPYSCTDGGTTFVGDTKQEVIESLITALNDAYKRPVICIKDGKFYEVDSHE